MNLLEIIPRHEKWIVSKDIVYIKYLSKIPILLVRDDVVWVYFDITIKKYVVKIIDILQKNNISFYLRSNILFFDHKVSDCDFHKINLKQFLKNIKQEYFYDEFERINFDFTQSVSNYLVDFSCYDEFKEIYDVERESVLKKHYDYWTNQYLYSIKREDIRDYIASLGREIKISLLF